jgi:hypothetical protein
MVSNMAQHLGQEALDFSDFSDPAQRQIGETNAPFQVICDAAGEGMNGAQGQI